MNRGFWKDKRVLVTGHTGFKGSWLSYWLARSGAYVSGLALEPDTEPSLFASARLDEIVPNAIHDIRDPESVESVVRASRPDIVFHMAAQPLVRASYERPVYTYAVNAMGTAHLLEALRLSEDLRAVVCVTTDKCYENREWVWPYRETDALGGHDPYASSKACAEIITAAYRKSFFEQRRTGIATARGGNVIGGGDWSADRIVPDLVRAFSIGVPAIVRNPSAIRPWQFVLDALNGYLTLAEHLYEDGEGFSGAWNFGPDAACERPVKTIAEALKDAWGTGASWEHRGPVPTAPHEANLLKLDSSKARSHLHWRDMVPIDETIGRLARWYAAYYGGAGARLLMDDEITEFESRLELHT